MTETLLATSLCGVIFSLTSGQPLIIVGTTGPILVFELAIYDVGASFSKRNRRVLFLSLFEPVFSTQKEQCDKKNNTEF